MVYDAGAQLGISEVMGPIHEKCHTKLLKDDTALRIPFFIFISGGNAVRENFWDQAFPS